jgi:1,4-dihydroxy-2-naphthoate octaprenyltransferase
MEQKELLIICILFFISASLLFRVRGWRGLVFLVAIILTVSVQYFAEIFLGQLASWLIFGVLAVMVFFLWRRLAPK